MKATGQRLKDVQRQHRHNTPIEAIESFYPVGRKNYLNDNRFQ